MEGFAFVEEERLMEESMKERLPSVFEDLLARKTGGWFKRETSREVKRDPAEGKRGRERSHSEAGFLNQVVGRAALGVDMEAAFLVISELEDSTAFILEESLVEFEYL